MALGLGIAAMAAVGCHSPPPVIEAKSSLTTTQVTAARAAGYVPSLTAPYAAIELFDAPVSIPSSNAPCVSGGSGGAIINSSGVVVGFDCRPTAHFGLQTGAVETPVYSDPSGGAALSNTVVNHAPTYALPIPSTARSAFPGTINDDGVIAAIPFVPSTNAWTPGVLWKADHSTLVALAGFPSSSWSISKTSNGLDPVVIGSGASGGTTKWFTYDTATVTSPTFLAVPSGYTAGVPYWINGRGDLVGYFGKSDGTLWAFANKGGSWMDVNASVLGTNPFTRVELLRAVNDNRQAVGYGLRPGSTSTSWYRRAAKVDLETGAVIELPDIGGYHYPGMDWVAKGINAKGHVVGSIMGGGSFASAGGYPTAHAFVWTQEWGTRDLNAFISPSLGLTLVEAYAINDNDEIVGLEKHATDGYRLFRMKIDFNRGGPEFFEPTDGQTCSLAVGINNAGAVTGWSDGCGVPWQWTNQVYPFATAGGVPKPLGVVSGAIVHPYAINNAGVIAANAYNASATPQYAALSYSGTWATPTTLPFSNVITAVTAINNATDGPAIAGDTVGGDGHTHFYSYKNGTTQIVPGPVAGSDLDGWLDGGAMAVNDQGDMVGVYLQGSAQRTAAIWTAENGLHKLESSLPSGTGWTLTMALGLNNSRQVVGFGTHNGAHRPFKMNANTGAITDLGTLEAPNNALNTNAHAINSLGHVVGTAGTAGDGFGFHMFGSRAFFYTDDSGMTDLNSLVPMPAGWVLADASGINDNDEVVGYAVQTATGLRRAYKVKVPGLPLTECAGKDNNTPCNDLNRCTQLDKCVSGVCVGSSPVVCAAPDQCHTAGTCQAATGVCAYPNKANGTVCSDGNACTVGDSCQAGACATTPIVCVAQDQCHSAGTCDPGVGCSNPLKDDGFGCNDGSACTQTDTCVAGTCTGTSPVTCSTSDPNLTASCNAAAGATYPPNGLVALWHLDGNGTDTTDNGNKFTSTVGADPVTGKQGQGMSFGANASSCLSRSLNSSNDVSTAGKFTFAAWVNPSGACSGTWPVFRRGNQIGLNLTCAGSGMPGLSAAVDTGGGLTFSPAVGSLQQGTWSHVAMIWDGSNVRLYVNGLDVGGFSKTGTLVAPSGNLTLGCAGTSLFMGAIDEAAFYARTLDPATELAPLVAPVGACKTAPRCTTTTACRESHWDAGQNQCVETLLEHDEPCDDGNVCTGNGVCKAGGVCSNAPVDPCTAPPNTAPLAACEQLSCDPKFKPIPPGDVAGRWSFDVDGRDDSGNGNDMTTMTGVQAVPGRNGGRALRYDAASSCVSRPAGPTNGVNNPQGVTFAAWVKVDSNFCPSSASRVIMQRWNEFGVVLKCKTDNTMGVSPMINVNGVYSVYNPVGTIVPGQWTHIAVLYTRSSVNVFLDGLYTVAGGGLPGNQDIVQSSGTVLQVGCTSGTTAVTTIDEPIMLRRALTTAEVGNLLIQRPNRCSVGPKTCAAIDSCHTAGTCDTTTGVCSTPTRPTGSACSDGSACTTGETCNTAGFCDGGSNVSHPCGGPGNQCQQNSVCNAARVPAPPADGVVGWWRFEGDTKDSSGHGLDLTNDTAQLTGGKVGSAYQFSGSSCMQLPFTSSDFDMSAAAGITMMAWVKIIDPVCTPFQFHAIMNKGPDYGLATYCTDPTFVGPTAAVRVPGSNGSYGGPAGQTPTGTWAHVAATWDHSAVKWYVNGVLKGVFAAVGNSSNSDPTFNIGCFTQMLHPEKGYPFRGAIDEAVLYKRTLSSTEINDYITKVNTPTCTNAPVAEGTTCTDGNSCTSGDECHGGTCLAGSPTTCAAPDACHDLGVCNPGTGACSNPSIPGAVCELGGVKVFEPTGGKTCTQATGINNNGAIVGYSDAVMDPPWPATQAAAPFTTANGTVYPLQIPSGATSVFPSAVGPHGEVLANVTGGQNPVYLYPHTDLNAPVAIPYVSAGAKAWALRETNPGSFMSTVAGGMLLTAGDPSSLTWFLYEVPESGGGGSIYPYLPESPDLAHGGEVLGTNKRGDMVGYYTDSAGVRRAMVWTSELGLRELHDVVDPAGDWVLNTAFAINDDRQIVGYGTYGTTDPLKAGFLADLDLRKIRAIPPLYLIDPPVVPFDPTLEHHPTAINSSWHIVGTAGVSADGTAGNPRLTPERAFVYTTISGMRDLNDMLSMPPGWTLVSATGINDSDEVSGVAMNQQGERRAFKGQLIDMPSAPLIACEGKNEGDPCSNGRWCAANNVCHNSVCGGSDPADAFCLRVDAVADMGSGRLTAVFGYDSFATQRILPLPNQLELESVVAPFQQPPPPAWLAPGSHTAILKESFNSGQTLAWRANGQRASTSGISPVPKQQDPSGNDCIMIGAVCEVVAPNLAPYLAAPADPFPTPGANEPALGSRFNGILSGSLSVSPSGAATYAVPIAIPPGIAGMAPNLGLTYNSQGGNGVAGQGWELGGTSIIHRCAKTPLQDGESRPVRMTSYDHENLYYVGDDGLCLDGKKLYEKSAGVYEAESNDFSSITRIMGPLALPGQQDKPISFKVVTKSGETRIYGSDQYSRVNVAGEFDNSQTAIWALDRVVDAWGNYFTLEYNDRQFDFFTRGLILTKVDYTGHMPGPACDQITQVCTPDAVPFTSVRFTYAYPRQDVRSIRYGTAMLPRGSLLSKVTSDLGTYALEYLPKGTTSPDDVMLPTRLGSISFCRNEADCSRTYCETAADCLAPLVFEWEGGGYAWEKLPSAAEVGQENSYELPARIDSYYGDPAHQTDIRTHGTQFVDLNADGRMDFILAKSASQARAPSERQAWENNGHGWTARPSWASPVTLSLGNGKRDGTRLVDIDGDGVLDIATSSNGTSPGFGIQVFLNRIPHNPNCTPSECWQVSNAWLILPNAWSSASVDLSGTASHADIDGFPDSQYTLADMDGDGLPDLVWQKMGNGIKVLHNTGAGWSESSINFAWPYGGVAAVIDGFHVEDFNRDGLADLVPTFDWVRGRYSPYATRVVINNGANVGELGTAWRESFSALPNYTPRYPGGNVTIDVDGDGLLDSVAAYKQYDSSNTSHYSVRFGTGVGLTTSGAFGYSSALTAFGVNFSYPDPNAEFAQVPFGVGDLNGDGLVDYIAPYLDGGQLLINTGTKWKEIHGATARPSGLHNGAGPDRVPVVPSGMAPELGAEFVDLDGNGISDLVQHSGESSTLQRGAWLNRFRPPVITKFPNGLARKSEVSYEVITTAAARANTYGDSASVASGTAHFAVPMRVVASVSSENGTTSGTLATTRYAYNSLRVSSKGRGPQGFATVMVIAPPDPAISATIPSELTLTRYGQVHPFTGFPLRVDHMKGGVVTDVSSTKFCAIAQGETTPHCADEYGAVTEVEVSPGTSFFVYAGSVKSESHLNGRTTGDELVKTITDNVYDARGNATSVTTTVENGITGQKHQKKTINEFGPVGTPTQKLGKITKVTVRSQQLVPLGTELVHTTAFDHGWVNGGATLAMVKKRVEPGASATRHPYAPAIDNAYELHTAYDYDSFGNVISTTTCANDFDDCRPDREGPPDSEDSNHLPFRRTTVSYDPNDFISPGSSVPFQTLTYPAKGRFPVKSARRASNSVFHTEMFVHDWVTGQLRQRTAPDGVTTCYSYDDFAQQTEETARCGTSVAATTTRLRYRTVAGDPTGSKVVVVTRPPTGATSWAYADSLGHEIEVRGRTFTGGFTQATSSYDVLGRLQRSTKPHPLGGPEFATIPHYDPLGRADTVQQDLGSIDGTSTAAQGFARTTYRGSTTVTENKVGGVDHQHERTEMKNNLGKVSYVVDANGGTMTYTYDAEGNLTQTEDDEQHLTTIQYDDLDRVRSTTDPDLGTWAYMFNAFGDVMAQVDGSGQPSIMAYDRLGRIRSKSNVDGRAEWLYDVGTGAGIGKLAATVSPTDSRLHGACAVPYPIATDGNRAARWYSYTGTGEILDTVECADGETFQTTNSYDGLGRQESISYPEVNGQRLVVSYHYTRLGFLHYLAGASGDTVFWKATGYNALGQVTTEVTRNGVETASVRNGATGWLMGSSSIAHADKDTQTQNWTYHYDEVGNLKWRGRADAINGGHSAETFIYDPLDRLLWSTVTIDATNQTYAYDATEGFTYDDLGNVKTKNDKTYSYTGCGGRPHAVCSINDGPAYSYDGNGNMRTGGGRTATYTAANKPRQFTSSTGATVDFIYGADSQRVVQDVAKPAIGSVARTVYVGLGPKGKSLYERTTGGGKVEHTQFLYAGGVHGGNAFALRVVEENTTTTSEPALKYYSFDHLGSVTAVSDEWGRVQRPESAGPDAGVLGYDPWGARRNPDGRPADPATFRQQAGHREFTGHETIPEIGLVNMNGRVYDPSIGRFLSPDPTVQFVGNLQSYNRYAYALNNPLRYTDPTGFSVLGDFFGGLNAPSLGMMFQGLLVGAACSTGPAACIAATLISAAASAGIMYAQGASWDQIVMSTSINLMMTGAGLAGGSQAAGGMKVMGPVINGVFQTATEGGNLGLNIFKSAVRAELNSVLVSFITVPVSQASAAESEGTTVRPLSPATEMGDVPGAVVDPVTGHTIFLAEDGYCLTSDAAEPQKAKADVGLARAQRKEAASPSSKPSGTARVLYATGTAQRTFGFFLNAAAWAEEKLQSYGPGTAKGLRRDAQSLRSVGAVISIVGGWIQAGQGAQQGDWENIGWGTAHVGVGCLVLINPPAAFVVGAAVLGAEHVDMQRFVK